MRHLQKMSILRPILGSLIDAYFTFKERSAKGGLHA